MTYTQAHLALPRPVAALPQTDNRAVGESATVDLALATAAYAIDTTGNASGDLVACKSLLARLHAPDGGAPNISNLSGAPARADAPAARFEAGMWAAIGLVLTDPWLNNQAVWWAIAAAQKLTVTPYRAAIDTVRIGDFVIGDGIRLADQRPGEVDLLRETALAGLLLHAAARHFADAALYAAARQVLRVALSRFRAPDGSMYAHAVTPGGVAGFGRDTEAEAILGLLCLRLRADLYADELLGSIERYAAARLTHEGVALGYSQNGDIPNVDVRATVLAAVFQREAGRYGAARATLRGLEPLRDYAGALGGYSALSVAAEAALDSRYLAPDAAGMVGGGA